MTDTVSSGYDRQTEGEGYAQKTYMTEQCGSATAQYQYCCSEELSSEFVA